MKNLPQYRSILIIDDDSDAMEAISRLLAPTYKILNAANGEDGLRIAQTEQPDLILLDLLMPGMSGNIACDLLRRDERTRDIPIMIITGTSDQDIRIRALLSGADDVIGKPFSNEELLARVQSKMRRIAERSAPRESEQDVLRCGNLSLDLQKLEVTIDDRVVRISVLEFNLVRCFIENRDRVLSRQTLLKIVWKDSVVSDRTVDTHMASLRRKLHGFDHRFTTIYSAGYILKSPERFAVRQDDRHRSPTHAL